MTEKRITELARQLARLCKRRGVDVAAAESCTAGGVAEAITRVSGSSAWFERGFVTYSNLAKTEMIGVPADMIERHGAVIALGRVVAYTASAKDPLISFRGGYL